MTRYRVHVYEGCPDLILYAPSLEVARFFTEMCGFTIEHIEEDKNE